MSGKIVRGWPSGSSIDTEDTMRFSALSGVRPYVEKFPLADVDAAFNRVMVP